MLFIVQFPLCDVRLFDDSTSNRLTVPTWPCPSDQQYLRSAGQVERRYLGGIDNWIGETKICNAKRACRFPDGIRSFRVTENVAIRPLFRRFFFDGFVSGKFELGFSVDIKEKHHVLKGKIVQKIINKLFSIPLRIPSPPKKNLLKPLLLKLALFCLVSIYMLVQPIPALYPIL